jgi:hypothetical protein
MAGQQAHRKDKFQQSVFNSGEIDLQRMGMLMVDLSRLSFRNKRLEPSAILDFFAALDELYTILRTFIPKAHVTHYDKVFEVMRRRIYEKRMLNSDGYLDTQIFMDLDKIYKDLYLTRQKLNLGIPVQNVTDIEKAAREALGLPEKEDEGD